MPALIISSPGVVAGGFTAGVAAAQQDFTLSNRSVALIGLIGTEPWEWSSELAGTYVPVAADTPWMLPVLTGQNSTKSYFFKRTGAVDSAITAWVAG